MTNDKHSAPTASVAAAPSDVARPELREKPTVILGAGPAGLTAGYLLAKRGLPVVVLEAATQVSFGSRCWSRPPRTMARSDSPT